MSILYVHIAFKRRNLIPWEPEQAEIPQSDIFCGNFKIPICLYSGTHRASSRDIPGREFPGNFSFLPSRFPGKNPRDPGNMCP